MNSFIAVCSRSTGLVLYMADWVISHFSPFVLRSSSRPVKLFRICTMSTYKLSYFNIRGLAEPLRFLLSYGGVHFEDDRCKFEDWPAKKSSMPFGQMPVLEVDGKVVHQASAIARYLGKQFGVAGSDDWEDMEIDIIGDTIKDFVSKLSPVHQEKDLELKEKKFAQLLTDGIFPYYLEKFDAIAKANNGHLAVGKLTWVDIFFTGCIENMNHFCRFDITDKYSGLKAVVDNVRALPQIKAWMAKRPVSDM